MDWGHFKQRLIWAVLSGGFSLLIILTFLKLARVDLSKPFGYSGDAVYYGAFIKSFLETGSFYARNIDSLGAPFGMTWLGQPEFTDTANLLILRLIASTTSSWQTVMNYFYLATFPLIALTAFIAFYLLRLSLPVSFVLAQLYTFLPYHFMKGEWHLFLSGYYAIPLAVWLCLELLTAGTGGKIRHRRLSFFTAALIASTAPYYFYFFGLLLTLPLIRALYSRNKALVWLIIKIGLVSLLVFSLNTLPFLEYHRTESYASQQINQLIRPVTDTETYSLKTSLLFMPAFYHRWEVLSKLAEDYLKNNLTVNENRGVALGIVGSTGLVLILIIGMGGLGLKKKTTRIVYDHLFRLTVFLLLIASVGGIGQIMSYVFHIPIRSYSRVSLFIAFMALVSIGMAIEALFERIGRRKELVIAISVVILGLGWWDQFPQSFFIDKALVTSYASDENFVRKIEELSEGVVIKVYNAPYILFPPSEMSINGIDGYVHLRLYLHSKRIAWSYGAVGYSPSDHWNRKIESIADMKQRLDELKKAGFSGMVLVRPLGDKIANDFEKVFNRSGAVLEFRSDDKVFEYYSFK